MMFFIRKILNFKVTTYLSGNLSELGKVNIPNFTEIKGQKGLLIFHLGLPLQ